ncbi:MAG: serine hydrolase [Candidatus Angelobacter sp. Gp1-AA117]|nr:MAG: serine hydrolase [Candidatus Angelobacter sp. Gp1-AA117]
MRCRIALLLIFAAACSAQEKPQADPVPRMEQIIQSYLADHAFMGSVLVARGGKTLLDKGYGFANLEWQVPNTSTTKFRLGSITKQFTAASILLLEERGKLKTDDLVKKHIPDAPAAWDKVTIFHLLTHTSGIPSFTSFPDYHSREWETMTPQQLVDWFRDKPLEFEPGTKWNYSNSGYVLLGYLIEKISGQSYAEFVQQNIFTPLGMKDSGYDSNAAIIEHRAAGYSRGKNGPENADFINMSIPLSAGALYSTTEDLLRWEQGLFGGKLLSPASLAKMTTPFKEDYAFGLGVSTRNGRKMIAHDGGIEGFNTSLAYYPDDKLVVAVLANLNGPAAGDIAASLSRVAHGEKVVLTSERKETALPQQTLAKYVGSYELAPTLTLSITVEDGRLIAQANQQPRRTLFAESETMFFRKDANVQIEFVKNDKGEVTGLVLHQGGQEIKGVKK